MKTAFLATIWTTVAVVLIFVSPASAAEPGPERDFRLKARGVYAAGADIESDRGAVSETRESVSLTYRHFTLEQESRFFAWEDTESPAFGTRGEDPWDRLNSLGLKAGYKGRLGDHWGCLVEGGVSSAYEREMDGSLGANLLVVLNRRLSPDWRASLGLMAGAHKVRYSLLPVLGADFRAEAEEGFSARLGLPKTELGYAFSGQWKVRGGIGMEGGVYRLSDQSPVERKGYVQTRGLVLGLYADWKPTRALTVTFGPRYELARDYSIFNDQGEKRNSYHLDNAWGALLSLDWRF